MQAHMNSQTMATSGTTSTGRQNTFIVRDQLAHLYTVQKFGVRKIFDLPEMNSKDALNWPGVAVKTVLMLQNILLFQINAVLMSFLLKEFWKQMFPQKY